MDSGIIQSVNFDERGLIPAILQDASTSDIIGLYHMNNECLASTLRTGQAVFLDNAGGGSRARYRLVDVRVTAEGGALSVLVEPSSGDDEHRGSISLLHESNRTVAAEVTLVDVGSMDFGIAINKLYALIIDRKEKRPEGSYTSYLFNAGLDKILKKIAEESGEVIIAAKNKSAGEIISELSDLFYHLLVLMVERGVSLTEVQAELRSRASKPGAKFGPAAREGHEPSPAQHNSQ
jgi:phosphoribosyl-ATP pyrophosphohydrolase/phosphoribosyl-AMP cyclohydrolase